MGRAAVPTGQFCDARGRAPDAEAGSVRTCEYLAGTDSSGCVAPVVVACDVVASNLGICQGCCARSLVARDNQVLGVTRGAVLAGAEMLVAVHTRGLGESTAARED